MKRMTYLLTLIFSLFVLTACSQDVSGTWYYEHNQEDMQMQLNIDKKDVRIVLDYVEVEAGLFTVSTEEKSLVLATGKLEGDNIELVVEDNSEYFASVAEGETLTGKYKMSSDKKTLEIYTEDESLVFLAENPAE